MSIEFTKYPFTAKTYEARIPSLEGGTEVTRHKAVIVGAGPVGLSVALGLANHGIPSVVVEADNSVCFGSRAICISRRSLEIIERLGALESFREKGLPWTGGRSYYRNTEVLHFKMPHDEYQKLPPMLNIEQFYIEQYLLDEVEKRAEFIDMRWDSKVAKLDLTNDGVQLSITTPSGDYKLNADWLVACDGGRSIIRESMGLELKGTSYEGRYVIADIALETDLPTERLAWFDPPSNPGSSLLMHRQPDKVWRVDYQLKKDEDADEAIKPENVIPRVQSHLDMIGQKGKWAPIWITIYKAHALTLDRYRHGRVMFAGDAAHLVPIFGVRGLNSGVDDADNLAWKLALTIKGVASEDILESYSDERVYATHENLSYGTKSTEFMAPPSFAFELMREAVLTLAIKHPNVRSLINPRQTVNITYVNSPLNSRRDESASFKSGPGLGAVLLECPLTIIDDGRQIDGYLTDLIEPQFTAFCFTDSGEVPSDLDALEIELQKRGVPFSVAILTKKIPAASTVRAAWDGSKKLYPLYDAHPGTCYLVRPDGHVQSRWKKTSAAEIRREIETVLAARNAA